MNFRVPVVIATIAALLASCSSSGGEASSEGITIGLPGIPPVFAALLTEVAEDEGFYEKHGVDVTLRPFQTGTDATRAMQSGEVDIALSPSALFYTVASTGADVVGIQGMDVVDWIVASTNNGVQQCSDLRGQAVGVDEVGGARYSVLEQLVESCGMSIEDVNALAFPGAQSIEAMVAGQLNTSVLHIDELAAIKNQGVDIREIIALRDVQPDAQYLVFGTRREVIDQKRDALVAVLRAHREAVDFMYDPANHDAVAQIATFTGQSAEVAGEALTNFLEINWWPKDVGLDEKSTTVTIDGQIAAGNIEEQNRPDYATVIDTSLWEDAQTTS
jgi:NitT/TauT family transport system substrate-binding protein